MSVSMLASQESLFKWHKLMYVTLFVAQTMSSSYIVVTFLQSGQEHCGIPSVSSWHSENFLSQTTVSQEAWHSPG